MKGDIKLKTNLIVFGVAVCMGVVLSLTIVGCSLGSSDVTKYDSVLDSARKISDIKSDMFRGAVKMYTDQRTRYIEGRKIVVEVLRNNNVVEGDFAYEELKKLDKEMHEQDQKIKEAFSYWTQGEKSLSEIWTSNTIRKGGNTEKVIKLIKDAFVSLKIAKEIFLK